MIGWKCTEYEVEGEDLEVDLERKVVDKDCWTRQLNKEDAIDRSKWKKLTRNIV